MASHEIPFIDTVSQVPVLSKELNPIVPKLRESDPRTDAFMHCRQVFWNDAENYPVQDIEDFFDFLKNQEKWTECLKFLSTCSDEMLQKLVPPKKGFGGISNISGINEILRQTGKIEVQENIEKKQQILLDIRKKLKSHTELNQENINTINTKDPSSLEFKDAVKAILAELKTQAQKSGDFQEYAKFMTDFHAIGTVSDKEFLDFKKELDDVLKESSKNGDALSNTSETLGKGLRKQEYEKFGDVYIRFGSLGEKTNEIVRIDERSGMVSKRIVSDRSGYAREIIFPKDPALDRDVKVGEINEKLSGIENKLAKITEYKKEQKTLESTPNRTEKEESRLKELKSLNIDPESVIETKLKEEKVRLEAEKRELPQIEGGSQELQIKQEKDARDTIQFVDDMGLYALGSTENIDTFFQAIVGKAKIIGLTIDPTKGFDNNEKIFIKNEFIRLIGSDIFKPGFEFTRQSDTQDINFVREKLAIAHKGVFQQEPPYITSNGIRLLVQWK